jgi:hypothetical protein
MEPVAYPYMLDMSLGAQSVGRKEAVNVAVSTFKNHTALLHSNDLCCTQGHDPV